MPRAIWKGTVSFGLVEIPVAIHAAVAREEAISFTLLDRRDFSPVGYERVNKATGKPVPWEEIVKGYEYEKGEYVVLTEDELKAANVEATQTVDILDFVDASEVDSVYWETPYYLEPVKKRKSKSYALLRETLRRTGKVAIAKVVIRTRQRLAALTVRGDAIVLNVLRWPDEVRDASGLDLPKGAADVTDKEVAMAERLVEGMTGPWKPDRYRDTYRDDVEALVERKVRAGRTKEVETPRKREAKPRAEVLDLMPLLERSLERTTRTASAGPKRRPGGAARRKGA